MIQAGSGGFIDPPGPTFVCSTSPCRSRPRSSGSSTWTFTVDPPPNQLGPGWRLYAADAAQAHRWTQLGYDVRVQGTDRDGRPRGWTATGPSGCVRFRRVRNGAVVKRVNGRQNLPVRQRVLTRAPSARGSLLAEPRDESHREFRQSEARRPGSPHGVEEQAIGGFRGPTGTRSKRTTFSVSTNER